MTKEREREREREMAWLIKLSFEGERERKVGKILGLEKQEKKVNGVRMC